MHSPLTTRQAAEELTQNTFVDGSVLEWQVRRLFEDGDLPEVPKFGGKRVIEEELLPVIVSALRVRGWLPEPQPVGPEPERVNETGRLSRN